MKGIYLIRNNLNDKVYIGSSGNLHKRFIKHRSRLNRNEHKNSHLQNAWNKYGGDVFSFETLLLCEESELLKYEQQCLDNMKPEYNIATSATASFLGRQHTEETKEKIRSKLLGQEILKEQRVKISNSLIGRKRPDMCGEGNPMFGKVTSKETKDKISSKVRGSKNPKAKLTESGVIEIRKLYATGKYTQEELGRMFGVYRTIISGVVNRKTWKHV